MKTLILKLIFRRAVSAALTVCITGGFVACEDPSRDSKEEPAGNTGNEDYKTDAGRVITAGSISHEYNYNCIERWNWKQRHETSILGTLLSPNHDVSFNSSNREIESYGYEGNLHVVLYRDDWLDCMENPENIPDPPGRGDGPFFVIQGSNEAGLIWLDDGYDDYHIQAFNYRFYEFSTTAPERCHSERYAQNRSNERSGTEDKVVWFGILMLPGPEYWLLFDSDTGNCLDGNGKPDEKKCVRVNKAALEKWIEEPKTGFSIPYSWSGSDSKDMGSDLDEWALNGRMGGNDAWSRNTSGRVSLGSTVFATEASIITPSGYGNWEPEGSEDGKTAGGTLHFSVRLHERGNPDRPAVNSGKFTLRFETSKEPGVCVNWPLNGTDEHDLKIKDNPNLVKKSENQKENGTVELIYETADNLREVELDIECYDYGAFGKLKVEVDLDNGGRVMACVDNNKTRNELHIPCDYDHGGPGDHIADAWQAKMKVTGLDAEWDLDLVPATLQQREDGDGYSLYEEYRGFRTIADKHLRTDPTKKDLFVHDPDNLVKNYIGKDNEVAKNFKIILHFLDGAYSTQKDRKVNINSASHKLADQYVLVAVNSSDLGQGSTPNDLGYTPGADQGFATGQSLKYTKEARINVSGIKSLYPDGKDAEFHTGVTVHHETGHALSVRHHERDITGVPAGRGPEDLKYTGGILQCFMRYPSKYEGNGDFPYLDQGMFCFEGLLWSPYDPVRKRLDTSTHFDSDNCWGQINVKMSR